MAESDEASDTSSFADPWGTRRKRQSDGDLRERMIDTATALVLERGLTVSLEHLSFEEVIQRAGISRSAAYRLWPYKDQFFVDLLASLAGPSWQGTAAFDEATILLAIDTVLARSELLETAAGRRELLCETVRLAADYNFTELDKSVQWHTYIALTATVLSLPEGDARNKIQQQLAKSESEFIGRMQVFYSTMTGILGLELRAPFVDYATFTACGAAVLEGLALRRMLVPDIVNQHFVRDGKDWTLASIAFMGMLDTFVEPAEEFDSTSAVDTLKSMRTEAVRAIEAETS